MKNSTKILIACGIVTALSTSLLAAGQLMTNKKEPCGSLFFAFI